MKKLHLTTLCLLLIISSTAFANALSTRSDLFVSDFFNWTSVFHYNGHTGAPLGNFLDSAGNIQESAGIVFGSDRNLYVGDRMTGDILRYNGTTGEFIDIFASTTTNPSGVYTSLSSLIFGPDNNLYAAVGTGSAGKILRFDGTTGSFIDEFIPQSTGLINTIEWMAFGADNNLYATASAGTVVRRYDGNSGAFIDNFVAPVSGGLTSARDLTFGPDGNLYVAVAGGNRGVLRYDGISGAFIDAFITPGSGGLIAPSGIEFGPDGNLYVAGAVGDKVLRYDGNTGAFIDEFVMSGSGGLEVPVYLAFGPPIPIPPAIWLFGSGLLGLIGIARHKKQT